MSTCEAVAILNSQIYSYLGNISFFNKPTSKTTGNQLAITDGRQLIDSSEPPDLIDFGDEEPEDLITFSDEPEDLLKTTPKKELLEDEELFPKGKKYNLLNDEDLIPTGTSTPNGVNVLNNILNYPETKNILGLSLTPDLKEKLKTLDSEASLGVASIISSLLTANRGKMSIYSLSRNQLKEIIEGLITTLSVILNPAQKI